MPNDTAVIILAAGGSSRLGRPKQLLPYQNTTLLEHTIATALATGCKNILVVTGAGHEQIASKITSPQLTIVKNNDWQSGMASSIYAGINFIKDDETVSGILIMLCDQPLITTQHLDRLMDEFSKSNGQHIIATGYESIAGVPAVFPKSLFPDLLHLKGDEGARKLIKSFEKEVVIVPAEDAVLDIDTPADYEKLMTILADKNI